jgi:short-subunit dehydrogenase
MKKICLITGCSSGIGKELARAGLLAGHSVIVTARNVDDIKDLISNYPETGIAAQLDISNHKDIQNIVKLIKQKFGGLDVLVNNAAIRYFGAIEECEEANIRRIFEVNFFGTVNLTKAVLPIFRKQKKGHIINISSIAGLVGFAGMGFYSASKFAIEGFSEALVREVDHLNINVTVVSLGGFRTGWEKRLINKEAKSITDYDLKANGSKLKIEKWAKGQKGDPARAASALVKVIESESPPFHLLLGPATIVEVKNKIDLFFNEVEMWKETTLGTNFE